MRLKRIEIDNYKSLRGVVMEPGPLSVLVGPNAAGKTNFCEALDFLSLVYKWNLEEAVANKGGYENICYRDGKGFSKDPIRFRVVLEHPASNATLAHSFEFEPAKTSSSLAPLTVAEDLIVSPGLTRSLDRTLRFSRKGGHAEQSGLEGQEAAFFKRALARDRTSSRLILPWYAEMFSESEFLFREVAGIRVFQLSALGSRTQEGTPAPNPNLERYGGNLPSVILHLKRNHPEAYAQIVARLNAILPDVEDLVVTQTRTLALSLQQRSKQLWPAEDLSDGTIQAIATLAAVFDPRIPVLVLEEPENNVHPWAIRAFAEAFRLASQTKQIILTTHSPILIDQFKPEELWIVQKPGTTTRIDPLLKLDPSLKDSWERGRFTLSEYLDSGALPEAVPAIAS